jgi:uncharacterized repeat protein (TIGR04052 family)
MKTFQYLNGALSCAAVAVLAACGGSGSREAGYEARIDAMTVGAKAAHATVDGGLAHELKSFRRADGLRIELQLGLINLAPVELVACDSASAKLETLLTQLSPLGTAYAHSDHIGTPPAGPVDAADADGERFDLGAIVAEPGTYCGLTVELTPESGSIAKHGDLDENLNGYALNVAACYYPATVGLSDTDAGAVTDHQCVQTRAGTHYRHFTLPFAEPLTIDAQQRSVDLTVVSRYEEWFDGIDMSLIEGDAIQQARLMDNIVASVHMLEAARQNVAVAFGLAVGGGQALCNAVYQGIGNGAQQDYELNDFRFYISDLRLRGDSGSAPITLAAKANGMSYQDATHNVALLGLVQGCNTTEVISNLSIAGTAAAGDYDELCFKLGLPYELNHIDVATAAAPMNVTAMSWSWLSGHKFLRIDGVGDADGVRNNYFLHLGSTGCTNGSGANGAPPDAACTYPNVAEVCLDYTALQAGQRIIADPAAVLSESDLGYNTDGTAAGCMSGNSDPECAAIIPKLGLDFSYAGTTLPSEGPQLFYVAE